MSVLDKNDIEYTPKKIYNDNIIDNSSSSVSSNEVQLESEKVVQRLLDHVATINEYNDRLDSIDYLINNANTLAGNLIYTTTDQTILDAIATIDTVKNYVDFELFKKCIELILNNYDSMTVDALVGNNGD